jgi:hypothetical protein
MVGMAEAGGGPLSASLSTLRGVMEGITSAVSSMSVSNAAVIASNEKVLKVMEDYLCSRNRD